MENELYLNKAIYINFVHIKKVILNHLLSVMTVINPVELKVQSTL